MPVAMRSSRPSNRDACKFRRIISQRLLQFVPGHRGHDSIAIWEVEDANGELRRVGHETTRGKTPRNFSLDSTGSWVLVANQESNTIVPFRRDPDSGCLTATGPVTTTPSPVAILFSDDALAARRRGLALTEWPAKRERVPRSGSDTANSPGSPGGLIVMPLF